MLRVVLDIAGDHTQVDITGVRYCGRSYILRVPYYRRRDAGMPAPAPGCRDAGAGAGAKTSMQAIVFKLGRW